MKDTVALQCLLGFVILWAETALSQGYCAEKNAFSTFSETTFLEVNESRIITSPNYPSTYPLTNKRCYWKVEGHHNIRGKFVIKVEFLDLRLGSTYCSSCHSDSISFYEGYNHVDRNRRLGTFYGTTHPEVLYTRKTTLWPSLGFSLITGQSDQYKGFKLKFTLVPEAEADGICRSPNAALANKEPQRVRGSSGTIFTPNYPVNFQGSMTCTWIITVPEGHVVKLTFTDSKLSSKPIYGSCDKQPYVEIRDGDSENSKRIIKTCSNVPAVVQSSAYTSLWIRFDANNGAPNRGFKAKYEAIPFSSDVECVPGNPNNHNLRLQGSYGTFQTPPYFPAKPSTTMTCIWVITVPDGKVVKLSFEPFFFQLRCNDYIEIRDGPYNTSELKDKRLCVGYSYHKLKDIRSSGRYLRVEYVSHRTYFLRPKTGFKAHFEAVIRPERYIISCSVVGALVVLCSAAYIYYRFKGKISRQRATNNPVPLQSQLIQPQQPAMELTSQHPSSYQLPISQNSASLAEVHYTNHSMDIPPPYTEEDEPPPPYSVLRDPPPPYPGVAEDT